MGPRWDRVVDFTFPQAGLFEPAPISLLREPCCATTVRGCGWRSLPACCSAAPGFALAVAVGRRGELLFGDCEPTAFGGAAEDGRDQPAPLVDDAGDVEVNLVVTRRECEEDDCAWGRAINHAYE